MTPLSRAAWPAALIALVLLAAQLGAPVAAEEQHANRRMLQVGDDDDRFGQAWQQFSQGASFPGAGTSTRNPATLQAQPDRPRSIRPSNDVDSRFGALRPQPGTSAATSSSSAAAGRGRSPAPRAYRNWRDQLDREVTPAVTRARGVRRQRVAPTTAAAQYVARSLGAGNARAAAQSIAVAADQNPSFAAEGILAAVATSEATASSSGGAAVATAEAISESINLRPARASQVLAKSAALAVTRGYTGAYARTMAGAFAASRRRRQLPQFTQAVTQAIAQGGSDTKVAFGEAIAQAVAQGGDGSAAVAEATATAFCSGSSTASAWSSAYAVALSQDPRGCLVLNQARALAVARCGGGQFTATAEAEATSTVLGFCGLLPPGFLGGLGGGWSTTETGSTAGPGSRAGGFGSASGWGK